MNFIPDSSRIMMSDSIAGTIQEENNVLNDAEKKFIIANLKLDSNGEPFYIVGSVVSYLFDEHIELEVKVTTDDAFHITSLWPAVSILEFEFRKGLEIVKVDGPCKVSAFRVQEIEPLLQMCVIAMKLCK